MKEERDEYVEWIILIMYSEVVFMKKEKVGLILEFIFFKI